MQQDLRQQRIDRIVLDQQHDLVGGRLVDDAFVVVRDDGCGRFGMLIKRLDAFEQGGAAQRLDQVAGPALLAPGFQLVALFRRQQDQAAVRRRRAGGADGRAIGQQDGGLVDRIGQPAGGAQLDAARRQVGLRRLQQDRIVADEGDGVRMARAAIAGADAERRAEFHGKGRALSQLAVEAERAMHGFDQFLDDDEAEAGAAIALVAAGIGLAELFEDALAGFRGDPGAGVAHGKAHQALVGQADMDQHAALMGEFQRIAGQVEQDLAQAAFVGMDVAERRIEAPGDLDAG